MELCVEDFEADLGSHFRAILAERRGELAQTFREQSWVNLGRLLPEPWSWQARDEAHWLIDHCGKRCDVAVPATGNSPRRMRTVGQREIAAAAPMLTELYYAESTRAMVSAISGVGAEICPFEPERFVLSSLSATGDTHGWHWDDYAFALVWVIDAPATGEGGEIELITDIEWNKRDPRLAEALAARTVAHHFVAGGEAYLLRSDTTLHRVSELARDSQRVAYAMAYASPADRFRAVTHETTAQLYPGITGRL